ncbi:MAG: hypothetical protein QNJ72_40715 [Pleurocapsa sp. MO_226.B13]|nr:hypothetical protein [Pleurocapsa sp. MO_226.B13]
MGLRVREIRRKVRLLAKAMHDLEWVDSGDLSAGEEIAAIQAFLGENYSSLAINKVVKDGKQVIQKLKELGVGE